MLPDTDKWKPQQNRETWLKSAYIEQCKYSETTILSRHELEKKTTLNSFDSGLPLEDIILNEFSKLFPKRYSITNGILSDNLGFTAGDCDLVVFNDFWFPNVISGATNNSRKKILPIDGAYAVGEIKSTLNERRLDNAYEKLVKCSRLSRTKTLRNRIIENRENGCCHGLTNPLYTFILATGLEPGVKFTDLIDRFFNISKQLKRLEVVHTICILGHGTITWGYRDDTGINRPALFMYEDLYKPIFPVYIPHNEKSFTLYSFITNLQSHLFHSVLAPEDFAVQYGNNDIRIKSPIQPDICLNPDIEWMERLKIDCTENHK